MKKQQLTEREFVINTLQLAAIKDGQYPTIDEIENNIERLLRAMMDLHSRGKFLCAVYDSHTASKWTKYVQGILATCPENKKDLYMLVSLAFYNMYRGYSTDERDTQMQHDWQMIEAELHNLFN